MNEYDYLVNYMKALRIELDVIILFDQFTATHWKK